MKASPSFCKNFFSLSVNFGGCFVKLDFIVDDKGGTDFGFISSPGI